MQMFNCRINEEISMVMLFIGVYSKFHQQIKWGVFVAETKSVMQHYVAGHRFVNNYRALIIV